MSLLPVTVLGLGAMGRALAAAFVAAGHTVTVWNRTASRADGLTGVRVASTAAEAVRASPLVVTCLLDSDAVSDTLSGAAADLTGRTLVDLTNTTPAQARARARWALELGAAHLDGGIMAVPPMIGGADALILTSGDPAAHDAAGTALSALGRVRHLGDDPGLAALHDIALLSGMYGMFGGALHAFGLARSAGVEAGQLVELLEPWLRAMLPSLAHAAGQIDSGRYGDDVGSPLAMQSAAFVNLLIAARDEGVRDDLIAPIGRLLAEAVDAGHGGHDIAAVVETLPRP